jgi:hypothetical protein
MLALSDDPLDVEPIRDSTPILGPDRLPSTNAFVVPSRRRHDRP